MKISADNRGPEIEIDLKRLVDRQGAIYYGGFPKCSDGLRTTIDLSKVVFFVFVSEAGSETLVIKERDDSRPSSLPTPRAGRDGQL
jgi:hypothetical protein